MTDALKQPDPDEEMIKEIAARHWQVAPIVLQITNALRELLQKERSFWEREKAGWMDAAKAQTQAAHASALTILELQDQLNAALAKNNRAVVELRAFEQRLEPNLPGDHNQGRRGWLKINIHNILGILGHPAYAIHEQPLPPEESAVFSGEVGSTFCKECSSPLIGTEIESGLCGGCADFLNEPPEEK